MNKEEKEAIDDLILSIEQEKEELPYSKESLKNKQAILNYIDKLQKENEELKEELEVTNKMLDSEVEDYDKLEENSISKDKIREYIKENKRVYEMQTPNRNRVIYKDCVLLTSEAKELLGE